MSGTIKPASSHCLSNADFITEISQVSKRHQGIPFTITWNPTTGRLYKSRGEVAQTHSSSKAGGPEAGTADIPATGLWFGSLKPFLSHEIFQSCSMSLRLSLINTHNYTPSHLLTTLGVLPKQQCSFYPWLRELAHRHTDGKPSERMSLAHLQSRCRDTMGEALSSSHWSLSCEIGQKQSSSDMSLHGSL